MRLWIALTCTCLAGLLTPSSGKSPGKQPASQKCEDMKFILDQLRNQEKDIKTILEKIDKQENAISGKAEQVIEYQQQRNISACDYPLIDGDIYDTDDTFLTATSNYTSSYQPKYSRLHSAGAWIPAAYVEDSNPWIEVQFYHIFQVTGVATQGRDNDDRSQWVKMYSISYSDQKAGDNFVWYTDDKQKYMEFPGNTDRTSVVKNTFKTPFNAQRVVLHPKKWNSYASLRWELYGCSIY